jgi:hypothetical protein
MALTDNSTPEVTPVVAAPVVDPKADWEWVEVPDEDLFGEEHNGISINFEKYGPGRHFVSPVIAKELKLRLKEDQRAQIRILQPNVDRKMQEIMSRNGKRASGNVTQ